MQAGQGLLCFLLGAPSPGGGSLARLMWHSLSSWCYCPQAMVPWVWHCHLSSWWLHDCFAAGAHSPAALCGRSSVDRLMPSPAEGRGPQLHSQEGQPLSGEPAPARSFPGKIQPNLQHGAHGMPLPFLILHSWGLLGSATSCYPAPSSPSFLGSWSLLRQGGPSTCPALLCGFFLPGPGSWDLSMPCMSAGGLLPSSQHWRTPASGSRAAF